METTVTEYRNKEIQMTMILLEKANWRSNQIQNYICNSYNVSVSTCFAILKEDLSHFEINHFTPVYFETKRIVKRIKQYKQVDVTKFLFTRKQLESADKNIDDLKLKL